MKTLLFIAHSPDFYGADKVLYQVIESARGKYRIHVVLPGKGEMAKRLAAFPDVELHYFNLPRFSLAATDIAATLVGFLPFLARFKKYLARLDPALVFGNTIRSALPVVFARKLGYPTLIHYHECNFPGPTGRILAKLAANAAKRNIFVCRFALESYADFSPGIRHNSIVIHNGIVPPAQGSEEDEPREFLDRSPRFITVGQLAHHKRIGDLLEAMPSILTTHPQAMLVVLGEGELRGDLERRINELGLQETVLLPGYRDNVSPLMNAADIFLAPFKKEACNMAVIEAMMAGKPVVATTGGGMPELVVEGETGFLYPPGETGKLVERIRKLAGSRELRSKFGEAARHRVQIHFNLQAQMELILAEIERCSESGAE